MIIKIDKEYHPMTEDLIKMFIILVVVNVLMYVSNPKINGLFKEAYLKLMMFILLGLLTYWLIIKNIIILE